MKSQSANSHWKVIWVLPALLMLASCGGTKPQAMHAKPGSTTVSAVPSTSSAPSAPSATTSTSSTSTSSTSATTSATDTIATAPGEVAPQGKNCPANAPIKAKDGKHGKIYHLPNTNNYATIKPTACFTDVTAAETAGYHAPKHS